VNGREVGSRDAFPREDTWQSVRERHTTLAVGQREAHHVSGETPVAWVCEDGYPGSSTSVQQPETVTSNRSGTERKTVTSNRSDTERRQTHRVSGETENRRRWFLGTDEEEVTSMGVVNVRESLRIGSRVALFRKS
jgi:hypothetical protein